MIFLFSSAPISILIPVIILSLHCSECPASPTVGRRPRLSSSLGRPSIVFHSPSAVALSASLLLLPIVVPVSPTASRRPHLSSSPNRPLVVFQSPSAAAPPPGTTGYCPTSREPADRGAPSVLRQPPWGRSRSLAFLHNPAVTPLPAASGRPSLVQAVAASPSCCRRSKLLLPSVQAAVANPNCCRSKLLLPIQAAHHRLEHRSIDSCAACVKSFVRT
jgi:hypothetical protein